MPATGRLGRVGAVLAGNLLGRVDCIAARSKNIPSMYSSLDCIYGLQRFLEDLTLVVVTRTDLDAQVLRFLGRACEPDHNSV